MPDVAISDFYSQGVVTIEPHPALLRLRLVEPADFLRSQLRHLVVAPSLGRLTGGAGGRERGADKREAAWSCNVRDFSVIVSRSVSGPPVDGPPMGTEGRLLGPMGTMVGMLATWAGNIPVVPGSCWAGRGWRPPY